MDYKKCGIIGCGAVGATTAFTLMQSGIFSEIVLVDIDKNKAEGEAMDMNHCNPFIKQTNVIAGNYEDLKDCAIVIITAGASQKPNQTRLDLVQQNVQIFKSIIPQITKYNQNCILLVVSNPVDILTYAAYKLSGFPANRVIGSGTVLDTARLKFLLGEHLKIDSRNVHAFILGEHGDSEFPVWSSANISGIDINDFCKSCKNCSEMENMKNIYRGVKESAYEIIQKKGATYYGIALATLRIVETIMRNEHFVLPVSSLANGHYGLEDLCISLPCIVSQNGVDQILEIPLDDTEHAQLNKSAQILKDFIAQIEW